MEDDPRIADEHDPTIADELRPEAQPGADAAHEAAAPPPVDEDHDPPGDGEEAHR